MTKTLYPAKVQQTIDALHTKTAVTSLELRHRITDYAAQLSMASNTTPDIPSEWEPYLKKVTLYAYKTREDCGENDIPAVDHQKRALML